MQTLKVCAQKEYDVIISSGLKDIESKIKPLIKGEKIAVISDDNVYSLFGTAVKKVFSEYSITDCIIKAGEKSKDITNYATIMNALAKDKFSKKDTIITLGGGVVGDLGAFVASTYMRGITLIAMPTSLLADVDSSVGGKTAINLTEGKNLCGTFYQPDAVYINLEFLKTLPYREIKSGLGEILKYSFLDKNLSFDIKNITEQTIFNCLKIKAGIVEKDEFESGKRKLLNLGHTVGHAIEKLSDFSLSHGECVAKGIKAALIISRQYYDLDEQALKDFEKKAYKADIDLSVCYSANEIAKKIESDKKGDAKSVDFILIDGCGLPQIVKLSIKNIRDYLENGYKN